MSLRKLRSNEDLSILSQSLAKPRPSTRWFLRTEVLFFCLLLESTIGRVLSDFSSKECPKDTRLIMKKPPGVLSVFVACSRPLGGCQEWGRCACPIAVQGSNRGPLCPAVLDFSAIFCVQKIDLQNLRCALTTRPLLLKISKNQIWVFGEFSLNTPLKEVLD